VLQVNAKRATAELAYTLQAAKIQQQIKEEEMQIKVVERTQDIALQQQEVARRERELEATVKRPADAEKYKMEKIAEAEAQRIILEAEADSKARQLAGEAEAFAIAARAKADYEQLQKKAEAFKEYKKAAMVELVLEALPKIAAEIAQPLCETGKITMVATGDGEIGAARMANEVMNVMKSLPTMVNDMTGVDMNKVRGIFEAFSKHCCEISQAISSK